MTMRVSKLTTYLRPEDAYTLVEFLDQLREMLMQSKRPAAPPVI